MLPTNIWKKTVCLACAGVMAAATGGCAEKIPLDSAHGIAESGKLYGMCYIIPERRAESLDIEKEVELMKNMGVKSVRQWMNFTQFMSDPSTVIPDSVNLNNMHKLLAACEDAGMMNIGLNHHCYCTTREKASDLAKPFARDLTNGEYIQWLDDYYTSWFTLVKEFPEVEYWEIDNEVNNPDFMTESAIKGVSSYSVKQMAEIATDMFYYATRAIHDANPKAKSVMGGLTEPKGLGKGNTAQFLQMLYDNIKSGNYGYFYGKEDKKKASKNPDDYFEIACWHPYMANFNKQTFIEINNEYYEIILKNEGKHKRVFFTEVGWNDEWIGSEDKAIDYMRQMFEAFASMPYVETVNMFKFYDDGTLNNWDGPSFLYFGFIHDPDPTHVYTPWEGGKNGLHIDGNGYCVNGAPKTRAYAFQEIAKGTGSLEILMQK